MHRKMPELVQMKLYMTAEIGTEAVVEVQEEMVEQGYNQLGWAVEVEAMEASTGLSTSSMDAFMTAMWKRVAVTRRWVIRPHGHRARGSIPVIPLHRWRVRGPNPRIGEASLVDCP